MNKIYLVWGFRDLRSVPSSFFYFTLAFIEAFVLPLLADFVVIDGGCFEESCALAMIAVAICVDNLFGSPNLLTPPPPLCILVFLDFFYLRP